MKIAIVLDDTLDKTDGVQQHVILVGGWLKKQGHEVHYLVPKTDRNDIENVHSLGKYINLNFNGNNVRTPLPSSKRNIKKLLKRENFDVLHVQMPYSPFLSKKVIKLAPDTTAVVGTFHILPASRFYSFTNMLLRLVLGRSLRRFDKIFAVSEPAVHFARKAYGIGAEYLPNPIDVEEFRTGRRLKKYSGKKLNIVYLGRLVKRKGIKELILAYNALNDEIAGSTRLLVCGKGPLKSRARELVRPDRDVTFTGFVPEKDKPDYLATADIAVFPSTGGESFGIVLVEAMAAGSKVVIGGDNPGYKSILSPQPYLLFDPKSTQSFANHLELFIKDTKLRDKMFDWQQHTVGQYDISIVGPKLVKAYKNALLARQKS